jgi:hypothetical protein
MVWGADWTCDRVGRVASRRISAAEQADLEKASRPIDGFKLITAVQFCLGRETETCDWLLGKRSSVNVRFAP